MAETFVASSLVLPGTYIRVRSEGLIGVRGVSSGNIGIVGPFTPVADGDEPTVAAGTTVTLSSLPEAEVAFGPPAVGADGQPMNLTAMIGELYRNGAGIVHAQGLTDMADQAAVSAAYREIAEEDVNILVAPSLTTATALAVLQPIVDDGENPLSASGSNRDMIAVIGADGADVTAITGQAVTNDRIVMTAPGYFVANPATPGTDLALPATYTAGPLAALISSLSPHISPTNKTLSGVGRLTSRFTYAQRTQLTNGRIMALEMRSGTRVVRGLTTDTGGFTQLTTRRITDFAKAGIRQIANPFIGRLNNERVRAALQGAIDGFLTTMRTDEQLTDYRLEVTATRRDEIANRCVVNVMLQPTFSIDFVAVTIVLQ